MYWCVDGFMITIYPARKDIDIGTLSCLDRIVNLYPETHPKVYPTMVAAYRKRGTALMLDYFHSGAYAACHQTARVLLNLGIWGWQGYYVLYSQSPSSFPH